jgi:hypothetical protein
MNHSVAFDKFCWVLSKTRRLTENDIERNGRAFLSSWINLELFFGSISIQYAVLDMQRDTRRSSRKVSVILFVSSPNLGAIENVLYQRSGSRVVARWRTDRQAQTMMLNEVSQLFVVNPPKQLLY